MIGSHRITIANTKLKYDFTLHRNITIIKGDSATGKTTLVEMVREYYDNSDAGYEFFSKVIGIKVVSAEGKSNIFSTLLKYQEGRRFIIADGAAFGAEMDRVMKEIRREQNVQLFLPESFEWLILRSGVIGSNYVRDVLEDPADYIESRKYFSWERFFTALLIGQTKDTYLHYSKKKLNSAYLNKNISNRIVAQIPLFTDRR